MNKMQTTDIARDQILDTVVGPYFDLHKKRGSNLVRMDGPEWRYLVAKTTDNDGVFLVWNGTGEDRDFTEDVYEMCADEAKRAGLGAFYHVFGRFYLGQTENVRFYQFDPIFGVLGTVSL